MKIAFFDRPMPEACLAKGKRLNLLLPWMIGSALVALGYAINGPRFFTPDYLLQPHGFSYHPIIGIPILTGVLGWLIYWTSDNFLGASCYLGTYKGYLLVNRRRAYPLTDLKLSEARQSAKHNSVVEILSVRDNTVRLRIPTVMINRNVSEIIAVLKGLDTSVNQSQLTA